MLKDQSYVTALLKNTSMAAAPVKSPAITLIKYDNLVPSKDNFYSMQEIEELKTAIELAGRVLDNLVVTPLEDGKYKILSGHRRHRAVGMLLDEDKIEYEFLPCSVEQIADTDRDVREQVLLIAANSQREKTAWDKLEEVRRMRDLQRQAKVEHGLNGRVRDLVARSLNISSSRVAKYDSILNNLISPLMEEIRADHLPISTAYELSKLSEERQQAAFAYFAQNGKLPTGDDVFQSNAPETTAQPEVLESTPATPQTDDVFQSNTLPGDAGRLIHQLADLSDSKLSRLAKLLGTSVAQLVNDIDDLTSKI